MTDPAIQVYDLGLELGSATILRGVTCAIETGHYVSIIGPNGAGKTTLLKCLNRILRATTGDIAILGRPLASYSQRELATILSYVPQSDPRVLPFNVREFVLMGRYPHLSPFSSIGPEDQRAVDEALRLTGAAAFEHRSMRTLSGGERQSVLVAAALAQGAQILLLDEPTTFLDYKHQVEVIELLQRLNAEQGLTIVSVTHDVNSAVLTSDRVIALKTGTVAFTGTPDELLADTVLEDLYETGFDRVLQPTADVPIIVPTRKSL